MRRLAGYRYLAEDPSLVCLDEDGDVPSKYADVKSVAWVFVFVWPVGMPAGWLKMALFGGLLLGAPHTRPLAACERGEGRRGSVRANGGGARGCGAGACVYATCQHAGLQAALRTREEP